MTAPLPIPSPGEADRLIILDGYLDDGTLPDGLAAEAPVRFQLVVSPTEDRIDELVMPCTVTNPELAYAVVNDLGANDLLRVSGHLLLPHDPRDGIRLEVSAIRALENGIDLCQSTSEDELGPAVLSEHGYIERYADYQTWNDPDTYLTSIWHASGEWVNSTDDPSTLSDLIAAHRRRSTPTPANDTRTEPAPVPPPSRRRPTRLHRVRSWLRQTWLSSVGHP
ncbi:hypothetical protein [Streptomyces sp. NBC_00989]|uniref:hypothetical protein n=1 Tax=Streptomyces sp. NBC_00989 TaxID=2903705 RepID=UPI002F90DF63|nr:hypothetical protein OG714_55050 [Streptomyces sp. NBC_00989]